MSVGLTAPAAAEYLVPEERALEMIQACAAQLEHAQTIPDVQRVITHAEAIAAVTDKIRASKRTQRAALAIVVEAERQLGRLTSQIPHAFSNRWQPAVREAANGKRPSKRSVLEAHGLNVNRCLKAERLAEVPAPVVDAAVARAKRLTVNAVNVELGIKHPARPQPHPMTKVARDAIGLLVQCQSRGRAPTAEEVEPLREAYTRHE